jgi:hypothetical protein
MVTESVNTSSDSGGIYREFEKLALPFSRTGAVAYPSEKEKAAPNSSQAVRNGPCQSAGRLPDVTPAMKYSLNNP